MIGAGNLLVIAGELLANHGGIGQEGGHFDLGGVVLDRGVVSFRFSPPSDTFSSIGVRVTEGEGEKEGLVGGGANEFVGGFGEAVHVLGGDGVAVAIAGGMGGEVEGVLFEGSDVFLAEESGAIAVDFEFLEDGSDVGAQALIVLGWGMGVLAIAMG